MITQYTVVSTNYEDDLILKVNEMLISGWQPFGGVSSSTQIREDWDHGVRQLLYDQIFVQAMIKESIENTIKEDRPFSTVSVKSKDTCGTVEHP